MPSWNRRIGGEEILIVEDSITQAEQLAAVLEHYGYIPVVARDGERALDALRGQPPALIISDVVMPNTDGYELCSAIKRDEALKHIPVILVTTLSDPNDVLRGLECGADNFIRKPIEERYLLSRIDYLLMNRDIRKHQKTQMGMEIDLRGKRYFINSDRQQILDLLISTYEQAVDLNKELARRERELTRSNEVLDTLYRIADELNKTVSEREIVDKVLDRLLELPNVYSGWVALAEENENFKVVTSRNLPIELDENTSELRCRCLTDLISGELTAAVNISDCECLVSTGCNKLGLHYHASVPLSLPKAGAAGLINLVSLNENGFDETQLHVFNSVAKQAVVALERARLHEHLEQLVEDRTALLTAEIDERKRQELHVVRLNRLYSVLSRVNSTIVRVRAQAELFEQVCRIAVDQGGFAFAWIATIDPGTRQVDQLTGAGKEGSAPSGEDVERAKIDIGRCEVVAEALRKGEPVICNNVTEDQRILTRWAPNAAKDYGSLVVLPLILDDAPAGVLTLYASEPDALDQEEMHLLVEIAGDIGFALDYQDKERRLHYLAYFDSITGLPNRSLFADRLKQAMCEADRHGRTVGVAMLDLDRFKTINDSLGHAVGDAFLKAVAERLKDAVREGDTVARIAGDEFGFILAGMRQEDDASYVVGKIQDCFKSSFIASGHELFSSASLGIAVFPSDGADCEELIRNADAAMYRAKAAGRNGYQFYSPEMTVKAHDRLTLENALWRALEKREFLLHYQPIVDATSGQIKGVEALVRWMNGERGLVSPADFIPIAEETSLIVELGEWVLEEACRQMTTGWSKITSTELRIAVNVSTRQFLQAGLADTVAGIIERTGIDPTRLTLEITESHLMQNIDEMVGVMLELGERGIKFSIDDFGTGYSSLSYLKNLPIANLKIDHSFVRNIPDNSNDSAIVKGIISMAHSLNLKVIAEGVETKEQLEFLRSHGCDSVQGYYFSKPLPPVDIAPLLKRGAFHQE